MTQPPSTREGPADLQAAGAGAMDRAAIESVVDALPDLFFLLADDGSIVRYRAGEENHLYSTPETFLGAPLEELMPRRVAATFKETIERCKASGALESCEYQLQLEQGPVWFEARLKPAPDGKHIVCLIRDISPYRSALARLEIYESAVSSTRDQLAVIGADYRYLMVNAAYVAFLDIPENTVCGMRVDEVLGEERMNSGVRIRLERCLAGETVCFQEWCEKPGDGERLYVNFLYTPLRRDNEVTGVVVSGHDITPLHEARQKLESLAHYDQLTGLPNRTVIDSLLDGGIKRARRGKHRLGVMFIDLDRFKEVNDTLGHAAGDALLVAASRRMASLLRDTDALARVGGDEFVAILDNLAETRSASTVADKLMQRLLEPFELDGHQVTISCSVGISIYPDDASDRSQLLSFADTAMYRAKTQGRSDWRFYTPDMTASANRHIHVVEALRSALTRGALTQAYHPLIDLASGACVAFEALARWHDPDLGDIAPSEFIAIAEQSGLVRQLDLWSMRTACQRMRDWLDDEIAPDYISVNFSEASLAHAGFCDELSAVLSLLAIPAHRLQLEIGEGVVLRDDSATIANLQRIGTLGVRLAVDNFGTGYASLSQLRTVPVKTLKIDGSFIRAISPDAENNIVIANTIIAMGEAMRMSLVAGGIEDAHQADFVRSRKDILGQGFFFGHPVSGDEASQLMRESRRVPFLARAASPR
ncbi:MAG: putative bifunctional diguanylate cyclase/phosphodiesterase [Chromatocurvus sp.]